MYIWVETRGENMNIILIYFALKYKGDWDAIYKALEIKERVSLQEIREVEERIKNESWNIKTILDIDYPQKLKETYKPPFCIWLKGDINLLNNKFICATGNDVQNIDIDRINKFVPEIIKSYSLVTAAFKGADEVININSLKPILYVLANGIDNPYSNSVIRPTDLMITEYPPEAHPTKDTFRNRNRIIASFADMLILFTSTKDGPINNLVTNFLNSGKEVYCFPGDGSDKDGNSELIKQGANLITSVKDINH